MSRLTIVPSVPSLLTAGGLLLLLVASSPAAPQRPLFGGARLIEGEFVSRSSADQDRTVRVAQELDRPNRTPSPLDTPAARPKRLTTNLRGFGVPFKINARSGDFIEVQLYLSRDQGRTWSFHSRQSTDQTEFPFQADGDGEYWFAMKTLNRDRQLVPAGQPQPELKIVVDSVKPELEFRVQSDPAGRVLCRWQARDPNLMPGSLKIFYQPITDRGELKPWLRVPVTLSGTARHGVYSDQIGWWPETAESTVNVAVQIQDAAGNTTRIDRQVAVVATGWRNRSVATARPAVASTETSNRGAAAPAQPDWAQPGWKPGGDANPVDTGVGPLTAGQAQAGTQDQVASKPDNVICEDGVCRLVGDGDGMFDVAGKRFQTNPGPQPLVAGKSQMPLIRAASRGPLPVSPQPMPPVGSAEEFVDPPIPPGYVPPPTRTQAAAPGRPTPHDVPWASESQSESPATNVSSSTTRGVDPSIMPSAESNVDSSPSTFVPSQRPTTTFEGDQVISQSTTAGPQNQYRGGTSTAVPVPAPELLPQYSGRDQPASPAANDGRSGSSQRPPHRDPQVRQESTFSQAGDRRMQEPTTTGREPISVVEDSVSDSLDRPTAASIQMVGSQRFRLNYGIDSIDPSGVGRVDLWITRDDGKTWNNWGTDPDNQSPFPVEVTEQGRYGFRIVVQSRDGLTGQGPASGDDADMWICVDTQSPRVRIESVPYGRLDEVGKLVINYQVTDRHLTLRPITISWAESATGPWQVIESGIRNEGRYLWKPDRQVPSLIFVRVEAVDRAGNVGVHALSRPIDVSGLVPRGTIHGVTPVGDDH